MINVKVSSLFKLSADLVEFSPTHVISLLDPDIKTHRIPEFNNNLIWVQKFFFDIEDDSLDLSPNEQTVSDIIQFIKNFLSLPVEKSLLIHCHAGASRSPAIAYIALAMCYKEGEEELAFNHLLTITNKPWPNYKMVLLADKLLLRGGKLLVPLEHYREKYPKRILAYHRFNKKRDL